MKSSLAKLLKLSVVVDGAAIALLTHARARGIADVAAKPRAAHIRGNQPTDRLAGALGPGVVYPRGKRPPVIGNDVPVHHGLVQFSLG
jgi:hypothetical protein